MTRNITLKIQLKFCGISGSQALMHLRMMRRCNYDGKMEMLGTGSYGKLRGYPGYSHPGEASKQAYTHACSMKSR